MSGGSWKARSDERNWRIWSLVILEDVNSNEKGSEGGISEISAQIPHLIGLDWSELEGLPGEAVIKVTHETPRKLQMLYIFHRMRGGGHHHMVYTVWIL